jgi:hypothetical protein
MNAPTQATLFVLLAAAAGWAAPADDAAQLLPPPVRQAEKRSLVAANDAFRRNFYNGPGGLGAAFSPDGKFLLTSVNFQGSTLWDAAAGRVLGQLPFQNNGGMAAAFTADSKQIVIAAWTNGAFGGSCPVGLWDVGRRERVRSLDDDVNDTPFSAAAVAPDGKTAAFAGGPNRRSQTPAVCLWDLATGDEVSRIEGLTTVDPTRPNPGAVTFPALAFSPDGRTLAVLAEGRAILVEVATGKPRGQFPIPAAPVSPNNPGASPGSLAFSPDGRTLAAGCFDGAVRRFDLRAGRELAPLPAHNGPVLALCCPADGKSLLSYGLDGQLYVWRTDPGREWKPKAGPLPDAALDALWEAMRDDDALDLYGCTEALAAAPDQAVPFLRKHVAPAPKEDTDRIAALVQDLTKGDYNARKKAVGALRKIGAPAVPALQKLPQMGVYDELAQRLAMEFSNLPAAPEQQRATRAVAVLERVANADARKLLEELAAGADGAPLTAAAKAALGRMGQPGSAKPEATPDSLWEALAAGDGEPAYAAIRALAGRPGAAALLRDRLKDVVTKDTFDDDPKRVAKLIAGLDDDDFTVRDQSSKDLRNLGRLVAPALRKALDANPSDEARRRLQDLLDATAKASPPPEALRFGRALEALEMAGGPEAGDALEALGKEARTPWMRDAAAEALRRVREAR